MKQRTSKTIQRLRSILTDIKTMDLNARNLSGMIDSIESGVLTESLLIYELEQRMDALEGKPAEKSS